MLLNCGVGEDSWESLGLQGDTTSQSWGKSILNIHWKDWCGSWNSNALATRCEELTHWKRPWCWERLKAGGEGDDRWWGGCMASLTIWTWVWVCSRSWWWTGKPGMPQSMGYDWVTELNWTELDSTKTRSICDMPHTTQHIGVTLGSESTIPWILSWFLSKYPTSFFHVSQVETEMELFLLQMILPLCNYLPILLEGRWHGCIGIVCGVRTEFKFSLCLMFVRVTFGKVLMSLSHSTEDIVKYI